MPTGNPDYELITGKQMPNLFQKSAPHDGIDGLSPIIFGIIVQRQKESEKVKLFDTCSGEAADVYAADRQIQIGQFLEVEQFVGKTFLLNHAPDEHPTPGLM